MYGIKIVYKTRNSRIKKKINKQDKLDGQHVAYGRLESKM